MDWEGAGLGERTLAWLVATGRGRYAGERRLDPFATSMRDFDDVSAHLRQIRDGQPPDHLDPAQRVTDLRAAGLVAGSLPDMILTSFGESVLQAWTVHGVATPDKAGELARVLLLLITAREIAIPAYRNYMSYWGELREAFPAIELIDNWDTLYLLNYLDNEIDGYSPGTAYRDIHVPLEEIEYDLDHFVEEVKGSSDAMRGAERVTRAISGKIPRGRARATFCIAMELLAPDGVPPGLLMDKFGHPEKPRKWQGFQLSQITKIRDILRTNVPIRAARSGSNLNSTRTVRRFFPYALPEKIDFSSALQLPPRVPRKVWAKSSAPKKIDHVRKQERNQGVGLLGENFAYQYELWRLTNHKSLQRQVVHVSLKDDTLGYDIVSWEPDGTKRLVEVKSTLGPLETRFFMTAGELACADANPQNYVILRVGNLIGSPICCELRFPFDELKILPNVFEVTFKPA